MELIILAAIAAFIVWRISKRRKQSEASERLVELEGDGDYDLDIVGESHHQHALTSITGGKTEDGHEFYCRALLRREPENPHDTNAIAVLIDGYKVGYLSRPHARKLSAIFDKQRIDGGYAEAVIVGGWHRGSDNEGHYGVKLDIPT